MHTIALKDKNSVAASAGLGKLDPDCAKTEVIGSSLGEQQLQSD